MANGFCNFLRQIEYPGEIVARHYVGRRPARLRAWTPTSRWPWPTRPTSSSANGGATLVWLDFPNKKTVPLPDDAARRLR